MGVVAAVVDEAPAMEIKKVRDRLDDIPLYDADRRNWLERMRLYYLGGEGEAWETALAWAAVDDNRRYRCADADDLAAAFPSLQGVFRTRAHLSLKSIAGRGRLPGVRYALREAERAGLVQESVPDSAAEHPSAGIRGQRLALTGPQQKALDEMVGSLGGFQPFLLFGRTGSGKTEVYLRAAEQVVAAGGQVLVLVPEIGLTPMWLARVRERFAHSAVWHSAMPAGERLAVRMQLSEHELLIGTRSALFLPLPRLQLIIVDEEHDGSFKQQDGMTYSARDMAVLLAQELAVPIVLGSATPSLESWRLAKEGGYRRLDLPQAIVAQAPIQPAIVDMRHEQAPVSAALMGALEATKASGEQSILFLNRRGYAPALQCTACGDVPECPHCSLRLTLHRKAKTLRCHACGYTGRLPNICPACGEDALLPLGEGTERLDEWLNEQMPELKVARFDRDTMTSHSRLVETLQRFEAGAIDCLVGTQMLVKGHHFPNVTLVGVLNADLGVSLPDFRAGERWWQQMTQVIGRAGRGEQAGRVLIQTRMPEAPWLFRLDAARAEATLDEELDLRRQLHFPPFARWVRCLFTGTQTDRLMQAATAFAEAAHALPGIEVSGPMPCAIERLAGRFRIEILLRDPSRRVLPWKLAPLLHRQAVPSGVQRKVDVDPIEMM